MADSSVSGPVPSTSVLKRRTPYEDRELAGLFELFDRLPPGDEKATLSVIARDRLRAQFPRGVDKTGVAQLASGLNIQVDLGDLFGAEFYVGHCNESAVVSALCKTLPQGAKAIDVGANFGLYALHAARYAGKLSRVVAFEPAPLTFGLLEANIKRNRLGARIKARRAAVSESPGVATFHIATDQSFSGLRDTGRSPLREAVEVQQVSLDTDPAVVALGAVDFLKIDTEGGEAGVLAGARQTIERSPGLVALMEYSFKNLTAQQGASVRERLDELIAAGMKAWTIDLTDAATPMTSSAQLPEKFNGSLLLAGPEAGWANAFLAELANQSARSEPDAGLAWAAAEVLLRVARQGQQNLLLLERWISRAGLPEEGGLGERVIKHVERLEADSKSMTARLATAEAAAKSDRSSDAQRQESERLKLKQEEVEWYTARLEQQRHETSAFRAMAEQRDADIAMLHEKIATLRGFMNRLSDQLQTKSEEVIRLMERREGDAAARGEIEVQWAKSIDAMRTRMESLAGDASRARAESEMLQEKQLTLRGHIDALNVKLEQAAALRAADAAEYERRLNASAETLETVQMHRASLQGVLDTQNEKLEHATALRAADAAEYERRLNESAETLEAVQMQRAALQDIIDNQNEKLTIASSQRAAEAADYQRRLAEREAAAERGRMELQAAIDSLNERLEQASVLKASETKAYDQRIALLEKTLEATEKRRMELRGIVDGLNEKLVQAAALRAADAADHEKRFAEQEKALRAQLEAANGRAESVAKECAALGKTLDARDAALKDLSAVQKDLERQVGELTAVLEERRSQIRTLQQRLALRELGRRA